MQEKKYYQLAKSASSRIGGHPGLLLIQQLAQKVNSVLDVGCGEGTRLNLFAGKNKKATGVDISSYAIDQAKKQYPHYQYVLAKNEKLPFRSNTFDLVYSTFVLEHTHNQELFINEMVRVAKKNGNIVILCPNYGAPNRHSPVSLEKPLPKLIRGTINDLFKKKEDPLFFTKVSPKKNFENFDDDTTCEPYLYSLIKFVNNNQHFHLIKFSSLWEVDDNVLSFHQRLFKLLGTNNISPFKYWGPQLFIVIKKTG